MLVLGVSFLDKTLSANQTFFCSLRRVSVRYRQVEIHKKVVVGQYRCKINWVTICIVMKVMLFIQIRTVNESSVTGDTDPALFST